MPLPPAAFLQATAEGEAILARLVVAHIGDSKKIKRVADLFCGIGTFALRLAETRPRHGDRQRRLGNPIAGARGGDDSGLKAGRGRRPATCSAAR